MEVGGEVLGAAGAHDEAVAIGDKRDTEVGELVEESAGPEVVGNTVHYQAPELVGRKARPRPDPGMMLSTTTDPGGGSWPGRRTQTSMGT